MFQRQLFICSAIEQCKETVNCCPHKQPHIKDERCVPRECRYAPGVENIDCVRYPPVTPAVPAKAVEQKTEDIQTATQDHIAQAAARLKAKEENEAEEAKIQKEVPEPVKPAQEQDIKDAVKKQAVSAKSPGKKKARRS